MKFDAVVVGVSAGGLEALSVILEELPENFSVPVIIVQHRSKDEKTLLEEILQQKCRIIVRQADEKEKIEKGVVYIAPSDYHLLIEEDKTFSLTSDLRVNYSRPSIDVLFDSAADVYKDKLLGIILTGANNDGAAGLKKIKMKGGMTIAQNPETAQYHYMPTAAINAGAAQKIFELTEIKNYLIDIGKNSGQENEQ
jgi:two-component system chemotaxis response regulator CheB